MQAFRTLRKRAKLTAALLLLVLIVTVGAVVKLPWTYQSTGDDLLLNSKQQQIQSGDNPYLSFGSALVTTADILALQLQDNSTGLKLQQEGYLGSYAVTVDSATGAPLMQITASASSPAVAQATMTGVMNELKTQLNALQANVSPDNRVTVQTVSTTLHATRQTSKKAKPVVVILAAGLIVAFFVPQIVERRSKGQRGRRQQPQQPERQDASQERRVPQAHERRVPDGYAPGPDDGYGPSPDRGQGQAPSTTRIRLG